MRANLSIFLHPTLSIDPVWDFPSIDWPKIGLTSFTYFHKVSTGMTNFKECERSHLVDVQKLLGVET